jgi:hypothetical protein
MTRYACRVEQCPHGRLERRWKNNIKMDLREIGCEDERLVKLASELVLTSVLAVLNLQILVTESKLVSRYCSRNIFLRFTFSKLGLVTSCFESRISGWFREISHDFSSGYLHIRQNDSIPVALHTAIQ